MRVDKNKPFHPESLSDIRGGIPLRLEIAARLLAALQAADGDIQTMHTARTVARWCLDYADILIEAHNESCEAGE